MRTTPDPDTLPTGLGPLVVPQSTAQAPETPRSWAPLPGHPDYESDGSTVRRVEPYWPR